MRDDKGFSLVELVVVIAIMAVMGGVLIYSFSLVTGQEARQCASNLSTALNKAKNVALTKSGSSDAFMELSRETDGGYVVQYFVPASPVDDGADPAVSGSYIQLDKETVGKKNVEITCYLQGGSSFTISETSHLRIYYDRISGAFKEAVWVNGGMLTKEYCEKITIKRGKLYQVTIVNATGKHSVERVN